MNPLTQARSAINACTDLDEAEQIFNVARERRNRLRAEAVRIGREVMLTDIADRILNGLTGSPVLIAFRTADILMDPSGADVVRRNPEAVTYRYTDHNGHLVIHGIPLASCYSGLIPF